MCWTAGMPVSIIQLESGGRTGSRKPTAPREPAVPVDDQERVGEEGHVGGNAEPAGAIVGGLEDDGRTTGVILPVATHRIDATCQAIHEAREHGAGCISLRDASSCLDLDQSGVREGIKVSRSKGLVTVLW